MMQAGILWNNINATQLPRVYVRLFARLNSLQCECACAWMSRRLRHRVQVNIFVTVRMCVLLI